MVYLIDLMMIGLLYKDILTIFGICMLYSAKAKALPCGRALALGQYVVLMHAVLTQQEKHHIAFSFSGLCDPKAITEGTVLIWLFL